MATTGTALSSHRQLTSGRTVRVVVPATIAYNLDKMQAITKDIVGRFGCQGCHSGIDIQFILEQEFLVNEKGEIQGTTGFGL